MDPFKCIQTFIKKESSVIHHHVDEFDEVLAIVGLSDDSHFMHWRLPHRLHNDRNMIPKCSGLTIR